MRSGMQASDQGGLAAGPADGQLDLGSIGQALWRKRWWVIGPAVVAAVASFAVVNVLTPKYKSEARILIEGRENVFLRPEAERAGDRDRGVVDAEAIASQVQLVLSRELATQVIRKLKLGERQEFDSVLRGSSPLRSVLTIIGLAKDPLRMTPEERVLEAYYERLTAYPVDKSRVIAVEFQSADPELAARVANAIADGYLTLQQAAKQDQTRAAGRWLAGEIETMRKKVAEAEAKVEAFRAKSNLFVGTNNTTLSNQQLGELTSQLAAARAQKADAEARSRLIRDMLKRGVAIESSDVVNSELIRRMSEQRATLRGQLAEQSSTLLDQHPRIKELRAQIFDLDRQLRQEAERLVRSLEGDARIAGDRVETLSANLDQLKRVAGSTNEQDVMLRALDREAKAQRDLLESYLAKYREATARDSLGAAPADARIISQAVVSNTPYFPKKLPIVLIATLATLLVAAGFITTAELLTGDVYRAAPAAVDAGEGVRPVPDEAEVEVATATAADPPDEATAAALALAMAEERASPIDDPMHDLVTALGAEGDAGRRVVVAGVARRVGATRTAVALARRLADESRVVMIDLSFEAPGLSAVSQDPRAPGVADLLRGRAAFGQIITRDRGSRAHLVAAGRTEHDPAAILASPRLPLAIGALAGAYDRVVIDAGVLDATAAAPFGRLGMCAVLVTDDPESEETAVARARLIGGGFTAVNVVAPAALDDGPAAETVAA